LKRVGAGVTVSASILVAAIFSIVYAIWVPLSMDTIVNHFGVSIGGIGDVLLVLLFSNAGTYTFTSAVPSYLLRRRNFLIQSLAHILSSTVASLVEFMTRDGEVYNRLPTPPRLTEEPLIAGLYLAIPIIVLIYISIRSSRVRKGDETLPM